MKILRDSVGSFANIIVIRRAMHSFHNQCVLKVYTSSHKEAWNHGLTLEMEVALDFYNSFLAHSIPFSLSHVWLFATPWTVAYQGPLSMEFSRQEYWSG